MNTKTEKAVKKFQCNGCVNGDFESCFHQNSLGIGCGNHVAGTTMCSIRGISTILLGLPKGFDRKGESDQLIPIIYNSYEESDWKYDKFNIPVWKHKTKEGYTIVRGLMPRLNTTFLHVFLEDCLDDIECLEITQEDIDKMD